MSDAAAEKQDALAAAYLRVFDPGFAEGQMVLDDILRNAGLLDAGGPQDGPESFAWQAGRRSLAVFILNRLSWSPGELALLRRRQAVENLYGLVHPPTDAEPI
jgi:hypothetical protein